MKKTAAVGALLAVSFLLPGAAAQAATFYGDDVSFTLDDSVLGLFGGVSVVGNTLKFDPTDFKAVATSPGFSIASATTPTITVMALDPDGAGPQYSYLTSVSLFEQGDYYRIESTGTTTLVGAGGQFIVNDVPYSVTAGGLGAYLTPGLVTANGLVTSPWDLSKSVAVSGDEATIKVQNILLAGITGGLEAAFIEKKLVTISVAVETALIPLPPSVWLLGSALFGVGVLGRRMRGLKAA